MSFNLVEEIAQAEGFEIEKLLKAVLQRYTELFPDWQLNTICLPKNSGRNEMIDRIIAILQNMKTSS